MGMIDTTRFLANLENVSLERLREIISEEAEKDGTPVQDGDYASLLEYSKGGGFHSCVVYIRDMEYRKAKAFFEKMLAAFAIGNTSVDAELQTIRENHRRHLARITDWRFSETKALNGSIGAGSAVFGNFDGWGRKHGEHPVNIAFNNDGVLLMTGNDKAPFRLGSAGNGVFGMSYKNRRLTLHHSIPRAIDVRNDIPGLDKIVLENFNKGFTEQIDLSDYFQGGFFNLNYDLRKQGFDYDKATEISNIEVRGDILTFAVKNVTITDRNYRGVFAYDLIQKKGWRMPLFGIEEN